MCGLLALAHRGRPIEPRAFAAALAMLRHRGPDAEGILHETIAPAPGDRAAVALALGHTRLAIQDLDARANQPFTIDDHTILFNGEIYNHPALAAELRGNARFRTTGDTETLLRLLVRDGAESLTRANGMWAFVWLDRARRKLIAARDRFGKKPLFYRIEGERIGFASEIAPLLNAMQAAPAARRESLAAFLAEGWLFPRADGATHLGGVREVRPGHALELDLASWRVTERPVASLDDARDEQAHADLSDLIADSIHARLLSDRRIGLLLSGGVDSTLILSVLAKRGWLDQVTCIVGDAGKSEDALYAQKCLDVVGAKALIAPTDYGADSFDRFLDVCAQQEKPFPLIGNVLGLSALYRAIGADDIRVVLDGAGGDEIFGGYWTRYGGFALRDAERAGDENWIARAKKGGMMPERFAASPHDANAPIDSLTEEDAAHLTDAARAQIRTAPSGDPLACFEGSLGEALARDASAGRMQEWLWQNDRNAMAASVENRSPLLDYRLAPRARRIYARAFDGRWNKTELRALFSRFIALPSARRADKQGFRWVYGRFLRANRARLVDLVHGSRIAREFADLDRALSPAIDDDALLASRLVQRLLVIAGLETTGRLA